MRKCIFNRAIFLVVAEILFVGAGCTTFSPGSMLSADRISQTFFDELQRSHKREAYDLFSKELAAKISYDQFEQFMESLQEQWGRLESSESVTMPFHTRHGESEVIPASIPTEQIQRYVFELKYDHAAVNCAMTLIPEDQTYKIAWFSFWGSDDAMTPELRAKIGELFGRELEQ